MSKWHNSLHFRLGFLYLGVFGISVLILGFIISLTTQKFLQSQLMNHVESGTHQLMGDYNQDGLDELRHDIQERLDSDDPERLWYTLSRPDGTIEFDPIAKLPSAGWHQVQEEGHNLWLLVTPLRDNYKLGVGISVDRVLAVEKALQRTFVFAILSTLILGSLGGYLVSRGFVKRLDHIKDVTHTFGEGDFSQRLPAKVGGDEFDQLSVSLNGMFDRIEALVSEVQRVTSNIAHDLRTPLGRIKQKIDSLRHQNDFPAETETAIEEISENLDTTLQTFSALLRIAEVELGTRKVGFREFDLNDVVEQISSAYSAVAEDSGRFISFETRPESFIFGDQLLVSQVLANLIENTMQHTPPGSKIQVSLTSSGKTIQLKVEDDGNGIDPNLLDQVTKPFFKIDPSRQSWRGSGLGLSLVAAVSKLHEAELKLENLNPGFRAGITFKAS